MAVTVDSSLVKAAIVRMNQTSQAVKSLVIEMFKVLESNPSQYSPLDEVDPAIQMEFPNVTFRKVAIRSYRHKFRVIFAHWKIDESEEHVDVLLAFPRKGGNELDWDWISDMLGDSNAH